MSGYTIKSCLLIIYLLLSCDLAAQEVDYKINEVRVAGSLKDYYSEDTKREQLDCEGALAGPGSACPSPLPSEAPERQRGCQNRQRVSGSCWDSFARGHSVASPHSPWKSKS